MIRCSIAGAHRLQDRRVQRTAGVAGARVANIATAVRRQVAGDRTDHPRRDGRVRRQRVVGGLRRLQAAVRGPQSADSRGM